jgi:hypothetical protein
MDSADQKVLDDIATYGWHVVKVYEDEVGPGFAFSIGLFRTFGHPEVIMFGLPPDVMHQVINVIGTNIRAGKRYTAGPAYDDLIERYSCTFRQVPKRHYPEYLGYAQWFYRGDEFPLLQCIWPDREGRFPWQAPEDAWLRKGQPVLGDL